MFTALIPTLFLSTGCTSVIEEYEVARDMSLSAPGPAPTLWMPDAAVQLSPALLDTLMTAALTPPPTFNDEIRVGPIALRPSLTVETLRIAPAVGCVECILVELGLGGTVSWSTMLGSGSASVKVGSKVDLALSIESNETGFAIGVSPRKIHDVSLEVMGAKGAIDISGPITGWATQALLKGLPTFTLTEVGTDTAPVRGLRITSQGDAVRIDLLTGARINGALPAQIPPPTDGFQVDVSMASLLQIARTESFRAGPFTYGILAEPTELTLQDDRFLVALRLWKTTGRGWWRDYAVEGTWKLENGEIKLLPDKTHDRGHSRGAALADPLVALGEGLMQRAIGNALKTTIPTSSGELEGMGAELVVVGLEARDGWMRATGAIREVSPFKANPPAMIP